MNIKKILTTVPVAAFIGMAGLTAVSAPANAASDWDRLAECESGGNWSTDTGNGFYGGLQFSESSWKAVGGSGKASDASKAEQIDRATQLQSIQGWGAWPACSAQLGLTGSAPSNPAPAPTVEVDANVPASDGQNTYVVQSGETLHEIAEKLDIEGGFNTLTAWNDSITDPNLVFVGQEIVVS